MPAGAGKVVMSRSDFPRNPVSRQAGKRIFRRRQSFVRSLRRLAVSRHAGVRHPFWWVSDPEGRPMFVEQLRRAMKASPRAELPARMAHPLLPFPRSAPRRSRGVGRPFTPSLPAGPYRLPHDARDRLTAALAPYHNRDAAFALATFLGRFWSTPTRLLAAFPIDRRALAAHAALGLTEARVRGAIRALEDVGFLDRAVVSGSTHRPTPKGLHRKPILFLFGSGYGLLFSAANRRAAAARERRSRSWRGPGPAATRWP